MNLAGRVRCNMRKQIELGGYDFNSTEPGDKCGVGQLPMTGRPSLHRSGPRCSYRSPSIATQACGLWDC
jgi:hypothetical protein